LRPRQVAILSLLAVSFLSMIAIHPTSASSSFEGQVAKAVDYLVKRFNPNLGLIYESDDPGKHWLANEFNDFKWRYNQTYWLYSDNLFAGYALEPFRRDIADRIKQSLQGHRMPPSRLFEAVIGEQIPTIRNAADYIVESSSGHVVVARRHDSLMVSYGVYADLICYRSLQLFLQGRIREAHRSLRQAISLWNGKGLDDWSYRAVDGFYSNQKLALLLYTSKVLGLRYVVYEEMERHLWSMQKGDGGLASLSDGEGKPMGSSNTETTALALLIYNDSLIRSIQPKGRLSEVSWIGFYVVSILFTFVAASALWEVCHCKIAMLRRFFS